MACHEQGSEHRRDGVLGDGSTRIRAMAGPGPLHHLRRQVAAFRRGCRPRPAGAWSLGGEAVPQPRVEARRDRKSTRLNSSHQIISYAVFCLKKKKKKKRDKSII